MEYGKSAIKSVIIINGGGVIALLTFLGDTWKDNCEKSSMLAAGLIVPMNFFIIGIFCGISACGIAYFSQKRFTFYNNRSGIFLMIVAIALTLLGLILFAMGALMALESFARVAP